MATNNKKALIDAAKELNEVLGLDPAINVKGSPEEIEKWIVVALDLIEPSDKFSKKTQAVLDKLAPPKKAAKKAEPEPEEDEGEDEEGDEETDESEEDEEAEEEAPPAKNTSKGKKTGKAEKSAESPGKKPAGPGVIATIVSLIEGSGKKGVTKEEILTALTKAFPDRKVESMKNTINVQVPNRISKERFPIEKIDGDRYRKAAKA